MGWETVRAGAIAKRVIDELEEEYCCPIGTGCPDNDVAKAAFHGRSLQDYYTKGKGSGLSWQDELDGYALVTTSSAIPQGPGAGDYVSSKYSRKRVEIVVLSICHPH